MRWPIAVASVNELNVLASDLSKSRVWDAGAVIIIGYGNRNAQRNT